MSLSGAINSAVAALRAQSQVIAVVSDNIANSETSGYKSNYASFSSLITDSLRHKGEAVGADDQVSKPEMLQLAEKARALAWERLAHGE